VDAKLMYKMNHIKIGGFRRLKDLDLPIRPFMVLIGANGVGKTSFLDAYSLRIGPQVLVFYRNLLNLRILFKNQKKIILYSVFKWLDIFELKMPKLIDLCWIVINSFHFEFLDENLNKWFKLRGNYHSER
jgi:hypothetical protein